MRKSDRRNEKEVERTIAANLRDRREMMDREYSGYTQADAADMLGISRTAYNHYETGERRPSSAQLFALAEWLRVDIKYFGGQVPPGELLVGEAGSAYNDLPPEAQETVLNLMRVMHRQHKRDN